MSETNMWVKIADLIGLNILPSTIQGITQKAKREGWERKRVHDAAGKVYEYNIQSLPIEVQAEYLSRQSKIQINNKIYDIPKKSDVNAVAWQRWSSATDVQRGRAQKRVLAVLACEQIVKANVPILDALAAVAASHDVTASALKKWYYATRGNDSSNYAPILLDSYRKISPSHRADITPAAWDYLLADYLRPERPAFSSCYYRLEEAAKKHGWSIPSQRTLLRRIEKEIPNQQRVLLREGSRALFDLYPSQERTVESLAAMEWINGDGYQHNVFVKWYNGEVLRPKTWIWQDIRTRKILAYRCDMTENSDVIRLALSDVIERYGIPSDVTIDNTRAAANKWLTGGVANRYRFKVKEDDPLGIIPLLGMRLHWTSVVFGKGHGQGKPIERAFSHGGLGELVDKHPSLAGAHTGPNPLDKPENYNSRAVDVSVFLKALEAGIDMFNRITGRQTEICAGTLSFSDAFERDYQLSVVRKATRDQQALLLLPTEAVRVQIDGTFKLECGGNIKGARNRYYSEKLIGIKSKVVIRFDPANLHESVLVYTLDGQLIDTASCLAPVAFGDTQAAREHKKNRTRFVKATKIAATANKRMSALEAAALLPDSTPDNSISPAAIQLHITSNDLGKTKKIKQIKKEQITKKVSGADFDADAAFSRAINAVYNNSKDGEL